jgi:type II secretion system protein G
VSLIAFVLCLSVQDPWVVYPGGEGPGKGKHIVFIAAEESYRSEESMPLMARILSKHHGFKCTVLFGIDPKDGTINPMVKDNIPGLEALETADLLVAFFRWRELPDDQMKRIIDYTESGKPIVGIRNATHPFRYSKESKSAYVKYDWASKDPQGGWGRQVLGETWVSHYAKNLVESTRCDAAADHPILKGIPKSFWIPDDVYGISTLQGDCAPILLGQPLVGWKADDKPHPDKKAIPIAWTKSYKSARVFTTTMGHGDVFKGEEFRRLIANACYWAVGLESKIDEKSSVALVGTYDPGPVGGKGLRKGVKPADLKLGDAGPKNGPKESAARSDLATLTVALMAYEIDSGRFPTTEQGLNALVTKPEGAKHWKGPYIAAKLAPLDPWGNSYVYVFPGVRNSTGFDLSSLGSDGKAGTADDLYR